jgi:hypothetical protein
VRATRFLAAGLRPGAPGSAPPAAIAAAGQAKLIGNALRELDRFLNLLIDAAAASVAPPGIDRAAFGRQRNTANKLYALRAAMTLPSPDHERLRRIGRLRECLFHCAEIVRHGDRRVAPARIALAARILPDAAALAALCRFYERVAADLVGACAAHRGHVGTTPAELALCRQAGVPRAPAIHAALA